MCSLSYRHSPSTELTSKLSYDRQYDWRAQIGIEVSLDNKQVVTDYVGKSFSKPVTYGRGLRKSVMHDDMPMKMVKCGDLES